VGSGIIYLFDVNADALYFHHNTVTGYGSGFVGAESSSGSQACLDLAEYHNNLFYNVGGNTLSCGSVTSCTATHNAFFGESTVGTSAYSGSGSPFDSLTLTDFGLSSSVASAMSAGYTLSSPYDVDMDGVTRGADGKWDRGAIEFNAGGGSVPGAPGNFRLNQPPWKRWFAGDGRPRCPQRRHRRRRDALGAKHLAHQPRPHPAQYHARPAWWRASRLWHIRGRPAIRRASRGRILAPVPPQHRAGHICRAGFQP
jgi:hypothetical protein